MFVSTRACASLSSAALLIAAACVTPDPDPGFTPAWEVFDASEEGWESTREALLIADCQLHNRYSKPVPDRNLSAKAAFSTAIRSPQLDLFSEDVLRWIFENGSPEAEVILHLGDALDLACEGEFEQFERVMSGAGRPWFVAPGNHDSYYFGNYFPKNTGLWEDACYRSGRRLTKDLYIRHYLGALLRQRDAGIDAFASSLGLEAARGETALSLGERMPLAHEWHAPPETPGFLDSIAWRIDEERPWRSFILQAINLSPEGGLRVQAILMDSCQYDRRPEMVPNGWMSYPVQLNSGSTGEMLPDQLRLIRDWLDPAPGHSYTLVCHHPFAALSPRARSSIGWLWRENRVGTLISAHTHDGYYEHHDLGEGVDRLELNIGSTTDWPMEWRSLVAYWNYEKQAAYIRSRRETLVQALSHHEGYFAPGWEIPLGAPDDYRQYKKGQSEGSMFLNFYLVFHVVPYWLPQPDLRAGSGARETEEAIKDAMLLTHRRLLRAYPTDPKMQDLFWPIGCSTDREVEDRIDSTLETGSFTDKVALLVDLEHWERGRSSSDPESGVSTDDERHRYKVCQAAWASRFESQQGRRLSVEDDLIRVTRKLLDRGEVEP